MELLREVIVWLSAYLPLASTIAGITSEDTLLFLLIVTGGKLNFWIICIFGFLGVMIHDVVAFFLCKTQFADKVSKLINPPHNQNLAVKFLDKFKKGDYLIPLLISKFIYGIRVAVLVYVSRKEKSFSKFFIKNASVTLVWFAVMMPLGLLAARGFSKILRIVKGTEKLIALIFLSILILVFINSLIRRLIVKNSNSKRIQV